MADSPTQEEKAQETAQEQPSEGRGGKKGAEERIQKLVAKTKEAEAAADEARKEAEAAKAVTGLTAQDLAAIVADHVSKAITPLQQELAIARMAGSTGMREEQAKIVLDLQSKHGVSTDEARVLAAARHPDKFPAPRQAIPFVLPPGASRPSDAPAKPDLYKLAKESNNAHERAGIVAAGINEQIRRLHGLPG